MAAGAGVRGHGSGVRGRARGARTGAQGAAGKARTRGARGLSVPGRACARRLGVLAGQLGQVGAQCT